MSVVFLARAIVSKCNRECRPTFVSWANHMARHKSASFPKRTSLQRRISAGGWRTVRLPTQLTTLALQYTVSGSGRQDLTWAFSGDRPPRHFARGECISRDARLASVGGRKTRKPVHVARRHVDSAAIEGSDILPSWVHLFVLCFLFSAPGLS